MQINEASTTRVILTYSCQHPCIRGILQKHWYRLTNDPIYRKHIGDNPNITFRRAKSLEDPLTMSHFSNEVEEDLTQTATWKCNSCDFYHWIFENHTMYLPNGKLHSLPHYFNCQTVGVIYIMFCECGSF